MDASQYKKLRSRGTSGCRGRALFGIRFRLDLLLALLELLHFGLDEPAHSTGHNVRRCTKPRTRGPCQFPATT